MAHANYRDYCVLVFQTETAKVYFDGKTKLSSLDDEKHIRKGWLVEDYEKF